MKIKGKTATLAVSAIALVAAGSAASADFLWGWNASATPTPTPPAAAPTITKVSSTQTYHDGSYTGPSIYQYYGYVQTKVNIKNGKISSIKILRYPTDYNTSRYINSHALPILVSEVIRAQSLRISGVSGATLSSEAFYMSVKGALKKAAG